MNKTSITKNFNKVFIRGFVLKFYFIRYKFAISRYKCNFLLNKIRFRTLLKTHYSRIPLHVAASKATYVCACFPQKTVAMVFRQKNRVIKETRANLLGYLKNCLGTTGKCQKL